MPSLGGSSSSSSSTSSRRSIELDEQGNEIPEEEEEEVLEVPLLTAIQAGLLLITVTVFTGVTAEFLIGSIDGSVCEMLGVVDCLPRSSWHGNSLGRPDRSPGGLAGAGLEPAIGQAAVDRFSEE